MRGELGRKKVKIIGDREERKQYTRIMSERGM